MAQQNDGKGMDEGTMLVALLLFLGAAWLIWHFQKELLIYPCFAMDWWQYYILDKCHLLNGTGQQAYKYVYRILHYKSLPQPYKSTYDIMKVTWSQFTYVQKDIGSRTYIVWCLCLAIMTAVAIFKMKGEGFRRVFTLTGVGMGTVVRFAGVIVTNKALEKFLTADYKNRLIKWIVSKFLKISFLNTFFIKKTKEWKRNGVSFAHYQAEEWKVILCGANFDPDSEDENQAPQKKPIDWLRDNKIELTEKNGLDLDAVKHQFELQLGSSWNGIESAPVYVQAICIMSALNLLNGDPKRRQYKGKVEKLRDTLSELYLSNNDVSESVKEVLAPYLKDKVIIDGINRVANKYAYINTACLAIYAWGGPMQEWGGGKAGILSSSMFRWLKKIDRVLWYSLNNVGRRKFHVEAAGVVNHFFAERIWGMAIDEPHVEQAVEGVIEYLKFRNITDIDKFYYVRKDFD